MNNIWVTITGVLQIALINLAMSGDNVGIIALATKNLPREYIKKASAIGIIGAILLRILFTLIITLIMGIDWLPVKLIGGLILIKITWDFIKPQEKDQASLKKSINTFWAAVLSIIVADVTLSLDNVLAIGAAAKGDMWLIVVGLLINVPIIFFCSQFIVDLISKYTIVTYICGAILARTAFDMILGDKLLSGYIPHVIDLYVPIIIAAAVIIYGFNVTRKLNGKFNLSNEKY